MKRQKAQLEERGRRRALCPPRGGPGGAGGGRRGKGRGFGGRGGGGHGGGVSEAPPAAAPHGLHLPPALITDAPRGIGAAVNNYSASLRRLRPSQVGSTADQPPLASLSPVPSRQSRPTRASASLALPRDEQVHNTTPAWQRLPPGVSRAAATLDSGAWPPLPPRHNFATASSASLAQQGSGSDERRRDSASPAPGCPDRQAPRPSPRTLLARLGAHVIPLGRKTLNESQRAALQRQNISDTSGAATRQQPAPSSGRLSDSRSPQYRASITCTCARASEARLLPSATCSTLSLAPPRPAFCLQA